MSVYSESDLMVIAASLLATCTMLSDGRMASKDPEKVQEYFRVMERVKEDLKQTMLVREETEAARAKGEVPKCSH